MPIVQASFDLIRPWLKPRTYYLRSRTLYYYTILPIEAGKVHKTIDFSDRMQHVGTWKCSMSHEYNLECRSPKLHIAQGLKQFHTCNSTFLVFKLNLICNFNCSTIGVYNFNQLDFNGVYLFDGTGIFLNVFSPDYKQNRRDTSMKHITMTA